MMIMKINKDIKFPFNLENNRENILCFTEENIILWRTTLIKGGE